MHDGSQATLADVMTHYEKGGIDRPSRSPAMAPRSLSEQDSAISSPSWRL
jgi:cytochrome c peroxidase